MDVGSAVTSVRLIENHWTFLGETAGFWCQTIGLFLAVFMAWMAIKNSRAIERRKAIAEVIFSSRKDTELVAFVRKIAEIHKSSTSIASFARTESIEAPETKAIRYALNHYEYIAVGIAHGIYDEDLFKSSSFSTVVRLYERTKPYIEERRKITGRLTPYQDLECLACRWKENPLKHKPIKSIPA